MEKIWKKTLKKLFLAGCDLTLFLETLKVIFPIRNLDVQQCMRAFKESLIRQNEQ